MSGRNALFVLGGARSGKSQFAVRQASERAAAAGWAKIILVTATAGDAEMEQRIAHHRAARDPGWTTIEAPLDLAPAIAAHTASSRIVVVDCLTLWLANVMLGGREVEAACTELTETIAACAHPLVLVSNEVGQGIVPETPLGRAFRDAQGRLNQAVAAVCGEVVLVVAGLPLRMKG